VQVTIALIDACRDLVSPFFRVCPAPPLLLMDRRRFSVEFQRFLIALSVRPGNLLAISAHLFPSSA